MVLTIDLPPEVARRVSELAKARGVDDATVVTDFMSRSFTENASPDANTSEPHIVFHPVSGLPALTGGVVHTREEIQQFLDEE